MYVLKYKMWFICEKNFIYNNMGSIYFFMYKVLILICMVLIFLWILDYRYGSEVICECKCYGMGK